MGTLRLELGSEACHFKIGIWYIEKKKPFYSTGSQDRRGKTSATDLVF